VTTRDVSSQVDAGAEDSVVVSDVIVGSSECDDVCNVGHLGMNDIDCDSQLTAKQHNDVSVAKCWEQAKVNKGDFVIILYHKDKVEKQPICQLRVPESKRIQVLKLAHDSVFGCHLEE